jgi:alkyl sulfatase BDS1-like metallo-beta-lactamase superfamily hydrolase
MTAIDPRLTKTVVEWADYMYPAIEQYGGVASRLFRESDWQDWGAGLLAINGIAQKGAPNAYQFTDWREWAERFNQALNQGS